VRAHSGRHLDVVGPRGSARGGPRLGAEAAGVHASYGAERYTNGPQWPADMWHVPVSGFGHCSGPLHGHDSSGTQSP